MSHVRVSEKDELCVLIPAGEAQIIIGFEPLETLRIIRKYAGENCFVVYDNRPIYPIGVLQGEQIYPDVAEIDKEIKEHCPSAHIIPAADIALEIGDSRAANVVLLGAFSTLPGAPLTSEDLEAVLKQRFKGAALELNLKAFELGIKAAQEGGTK